LAVQPGGREMRARGGQLYVFADEQAGFTDSDSVTVE
jgi:hypothetical protein